MEVRLRLLYADNVNARAMLRVCLDGGSKRLKVKDDIDEVFITQTVIAFRKQTLAITCSASYLHSRIVIYFSIVIIYG